MQTEPFVERIMRELSQRLPSGVGQLGGELEHNLRALLNEGISRLDLISREEFDIQQQVLARTRAKLDKLEKQVSELEAAQK